MGAVTKVWAHRGASGSAPENTLPAFELAIEQGADGLEFTLGFWIADPENGALGLRSQINVAILQALRAHGT